MKITEDQIDIKKIAGKTGSGSPVVYVVSKGGLHCFFTKKENGEVVSLGAAPHRAIALFFAEQQEPSIKWEDEFIQKGEAYEDTLQKSEATRWHRLRDLMFCQNLEYRQPPTNAQVFVIYDAGSKDFQVAQRDEVTEMIQKGEMDRYDLIRPVNISRKAELLEDDPDFGEAFRKRGSHVQK